MLSLNCDFDYAVKHSLSHEGDGFSFVHLSERQAWTKSLLANSKEMT